MTESRDGWTDRLSEYLDDELAPGQRAELEAHLASCQECRSTVAALQVVRDRAASLGARPAAAPGRDLWPGIAARIATAAPTAAGPARGVDRRGGSGRRRFTLSVPQLAAAAVLIALLGGAGALLLTRAGRAPGVAARATSPGAASPGAPPGSARLTALDRTASESDVDRAVADLEGVLKQKRDRLDPATARVLDRNLATIDSALAQIHQALKQQPTDGYLNRSLTSTMLRKLDVLRLAVRLVGTTT
jgi:Putative zinc-finger